MNEVIQICQTCSSKLNNLQLFDDITLITSETQIHFFLLMWDSNFSKKYYENVNTVFAINYYPSGLRVLSAVTLFSFPSF